MNENKSKSKTTNMHDHHRLNNNIYYYLVYDDHTYKLRILLIDDADNRIGNPT